MICAPGATAIHHFGCANWFAHRTPGLPPIFSCDKVSGMDYALHSIHPHPHGDMPPRRGAAAFALLLVLMLTAVLGGAVLVSQLVVQQRLQSVAHRNLRYQQETAADAAARHLLTIMPPDAETITNITVTIPLPDIPPIAFEWKPAPTSAVAVPPGIRRIRAQISDTTHDEVDYEQDYIIWRDGDGHHRIARW